MLHLELKDKDDKLSGVLRVPNSKDDRGEAADEDNAEEDDTLRTKQMQTRSSESTKLNRLCAAA